jgi:hypothetical protein
MVPRSSFYFKSSCFLLARSYARAYVTFLKIVIKLLVLGPRKILNDLACDAGGALDELAIRSEALNFPARLFQRQTKA